MADPFSWLGLGAAAEAGAGAAGAGTAIAATGAALGTAAPAAAATAGTGLFGLSASQLAGISTAATIGSGILGGVGALQQNRAIGDAAKYQAAVQRNNQTIAQQNAARDAAVGRAQAQISDERTAALLGLAMAGQGTSGIETESPTYQQARTGIARAGRLDTLTKMDTAAQQVRAEQIAATGDIAQAQLLQQQAGQAGTAGLIGAGAAGVGTAASLADRWLRMQTAGVPGYA
jgi:hypothetical protein